MNISLDQDSWALKLHIMNFEFVSKSFNVIPCLFIYLGRQRIIDYVQSQATPKTSHMENFAIIVNQ